MGWSRPLQHRFQLSKDSMASSSFHGFHVAKPQDPSGTFTKYAAGPHLGKVTAR